MTCPQGRGDWHSYVKQSLSEIEMREMTGHLTHCVTCRELVAGIEAMADFLADKGATPLSPESIIRNVMASIDKNKYKPKELLRPLSLRHWGLSLVAAGLVMFLINPTPLAITIAKLNDEMGLQMAQPFDQMDIVTRSAFAKAKMLHTITDMKQPKVKKEAP